MEKKSPSRDSLELHKMEEKEKHKKKKKKKKELIAEKEAMEKKVEELTRLLAEEKQTARRTVAKLQREVARLKSERNYAQRGESREGLMKELDRERMSRVDAEHRLHDMRLESDSCRSRLQALQDEFRKMEEMVRSMLQYKVKIDQLKQEKTNLAATFEVNLQKSRSQVSELERENMMLLNQVKKLESQMTGKGDDQDKSKLLLQRLKMLEAENSALVLENEQQRQQYEKCLDEIANQVVQALLAQKTLREECMKLQTRVHDLEHQNRHLNYMFQHRLRYNESQSHSTCQPPTKIHTAEVRSVITETNTTQTTPSTPTTTTPHPQTQQQVRLPHPNRQPNKHKQRGATPELLENSTESIQSMCSDYMFDDSPGMPQMSSPPPWLKEKLDRRMEDGHLSRSSTESPSSIPSSASPVSLSSPTTAEPSVGIQDKHKSKSSPALQTKIETEFPVNNTSPKVKHISLSESGSKSLDRSQMHPGKVLTKLGSRLHKRTKNNKNPVNPGSPVAQSKIPMSSKGTPVLSANQIPPQRSCDSPKSNVTNQRSANITGSGSPRIPSRGIPVLSANALPRQRSCESPREPVSNGVRRRSCDSPPDSRVIGPKHSTPLDSLKCRQTQTREGSTKLENSLKHGPLDSSKLRQIRESSPKLENGSKPSSVDSSKLRQTREGSPKLENGSKPSSVDSSKLRQTREGSPKLENGSKSSPLDSSKLRQIQMREGSPKLEGSHHNGNSKMSVPFRSQYYYDYSDEDSDCRPVNPDCDTESTMSLNELLDNSMDDDMQMDDDFLSDWSPICLSPTNQSTEYPLSMTPQGMFFNMSGGKPVPVIQSKSGPYATIIVKEGKSTIVDEAYGIAGCRPLRPDNLILVPRDKQFTSCGFSSSSSSTEDAKSFLSTPVNKLESCEEQVTEDNSEKSENSKNSDTLRCVDHQVSSVAVGDVDAENCSSVDDVHKENCSTVDGVHKENCSTVNDVHKVNYSAVDDVHKVTCSVDAVGGGGHVCSSSPSEQNSKDSVPKTSTSVTEHVNENKTSSKIPLMSPSSPRKAPPPVPKKPKIQKTLSPVSPLKISSNKTKVLPSKSDKGNCSTSKTFSAVGKVSSTPSSSKSGSPNDEKSSKSESSNSEKVSKSGLSNEQNSKSNLRICEKNSKSGLPICEKTSKSGLAVSEKHSKSGLPICEKNSKSGLPIFEKNSKSGLTISENSKSALPICETNSKFGLPVSEKNSKSGLTIFENSKSGSPIVEKYSKSELSMNEKCCDTGSAVSEATVGKDFTSAVRFEPTVKLDSLKGSDKVNGLVLDKNGLPYLCENLTVERQRDLAAFLVQDVIERVKNQDATIFQHKCQSSDSSFESVRVERSGSKDDGYSTMSSDIQPEVLKEFADHAVKNNEGITCEHDSEKMVKVKVKGHLQDFSSDPDSAMENSTHSCEMRTSSHSLSSQVSTSSGEGLLSPGHKVQNMKKFFEEAAKKTSGSESDRSPATSPQSPVINCHSELGKISKIPIFQQSSSQVSSTISQENEFSKVAVSQTSMQNTNIQSSAKESDSMGDNSDRLFDSRKDNSSLSGGGCNSNSDRLFNSRKDNSSLDNSNSDRLFDSRKDNSSLDNSDRLFDSRKDNSSLSEGSCNSSEDELSLNDGSVLATDIFYQDISGSSGKDDSGLGHMTSLHISEEKILEDIPEDDEWDVLHNKNIQEHFHDQYAVHHYSHSMKDSSSLETIRPLSTSSITSQPPASPSLASLPCVCLMKAKSETELSSLRYPRTTSKYEDFLDGNWDSGKVPERSASVSEMDIREPAVSDWLMTFRRKVILMNINESSVLYRVQTIINRLYSSQTCLSVDSDTSGEKIVFENFIEKWKEKEKRPYNLPVWNPKETMETFLKNSTPSPVSVTKFECANAEDWLLQFSKDDIDRHLNSTASQATSVDTTSPPTQDNVKHLNQTQENVKHLSNQTQENVKHLSNQTSNKCNSRDITSENKQCAWVSSNQTKTFESCDGHTSEKCLNGNCGSSQREAGADDEFCKSPSVEHECQSPSAEQTRFNSRFYSLCPVGPDSKSSLFSNGSQDCDINKLLPDSAASTIKCQLPARDSIESKEFEVISRQIADLSKTVSDLHQSLSSLNSDIGSTDDLHSYLPCSSVVPPRNVLDGYHWEEDEIFMTSCGGEVIIGSCEMISAEHSDWMNDSMEENGAGCLMNSDSMADIPDQFYEIQFNGSSSSNRHFPADIHCGERRAMANGRHSMRSSADDINCVERTAMANVRHSVQSSVDNKSCLCWEKRASFTEASLEDPVKRANLLDSMLVSGGESNDSLASDIGLDHMMCQRLTGGAGKRLDHPVSNSGQLPLDFSKFFIRYGEQEQQAVAAFDFLDDFSSPSNSESASMQQLNHHDNDVKSASPPACPSVCVLNCRIDANGRVRKIDKNRRKKRGDARKEQKQRENDAKSHVPRYGCDRNSHRVSSNSSDFLPGEGLSLSDSCHESYSSSSPTFNSVTML